MTPKRDIDTIPHLAFSPQLAPAPLLFYTRYMTLSSYLTLPPELVPLEPYAAKIKARLRQDIAIIETTIEDLEQYLTELLSAESTPRDIALLLASVPKGYGEATAQRRRDQLLTAISYALVLQKALDQDLS